MKAFQNLRNALASSSQATLQAQSESQVSRSSSSRKSKNRAQSTSSEGVKPKRRLSFSRLSRSPPTQPTEEKVENSLHRVTSSTNLQKFSGATKIRRSVSNEKLTTCVERKRRDINSSPKSSNFAIKRLGFPCELPNNLVTDVGIQGQFENKDKKAGVIITKSLLVLRVEENSIFYDTLKICDFLTHIENEKISGKKEFYNKLKSFRSNGKRFNIRLRRPLWNTPATKLPKGYDRAPGYNYICGLMILYPGGNLGMNVKSYNSKVYVTSTDQLSMASATCLMGDCIVDVNGTPVTSTASCRERMISELKEKKYVMMTIERAVDMQALRVVKYVLLVQKVPEKDPRMAQDTTKIGLDEAERIRRSTLPVHLKSIYHGKHESRQKRLIIREMSMFTPIGADPFNPLLMQAVPPKKMDVLHASKSGQLNISDQIQQSKE
ncbi:unnamed protein product [Thelazia callipaeda]|uniref:PDZ domain-containing protein n=1 Tax=Thelazia callipaeda TaxID=103827 RepID=A0A0N5D222_THECL|nr:unnamed protein product [Thelazia callipaeda]